MGSFDDLAEEGLGCRGVRCVRGFAVWSFDSSGDGSNKLNAKCRGNN